jgi:hypothetical protein
MQNFNKLTNGEWPTAKTVLSNRARKAAKKAFPKAARNEQPITPQFVASLPVKHS